ncbi:MAG TPA: glycosyltransferase [Rhodocyclaceae bacterium]|nr:glycosyltransferase [Rhodocyclaceae bacterium]
MKVLHVVPSYYPATYWGGPIFSVYALNNALACLPGVELTVLTTDSAGPRPSQRVNPEGVAGLYPNQEVAMTRRLAGSSISFQLLWKLPGLLRRADIVHLTATYSFPTLPTMLLCRLFDKPLVWSPRGAIQDAHEWEGVRRRRLKRWWERVCNALLWKRGAVAHTTSERERVATQLRIPHARAVIIPNGVHVPETVPVREWLPQGRLRLMYLGRIAPKKGLENLLEAVALLDREDLGLTIYGTGEPEYVAELNALAERQNFADGRVRFAGHVDGAAKEAAFAEADLCVVPSHTENFCMVAAEALAHGIPVIASRGTPWEAVEAKECGLWVDNSPQELARAIERAGQMDLAAMGARGRAWMQREFSWDAVAADMMSVYRSILAGKLPNEDGLGTQ